MDYVFLLSLLVVGGGVGFLAGLLGVGGGMTMVPFMVMLFGVRDFPPGEIVKIAIATSLAVNLFTSLSSLRAHHQHGAVRMDLLKTMGLGALIGTFLGANAAGALDGSILAGFFGLFVGYSAWQILKGRKPKPGRVVPGGLALGLVGGCIGAISSLLGAGGRLSDHSLPNLVQRLNAPCCGDLGRPGLSDRLGGTGRIHIGRSGGGGPSDGIGGLHLPACAGCPCIGLGAHSTLGSKDGAQDRCLDAAPLVRSPLVLSGCLHAHAGGLVVMAGIEPATLAL